MKKYFYGHYFKLQSNNETISLIPSYSRVGNQYLASLQIITKDKSYVIDYDYSLYKKGKDFEVSIDNNKFTKEGIELNIDKEDIKLFGNIKFDDFIKFNKNIMGPFKLIPFMECRHEVVNIKFKINGIINLNGKEYNFNDSYGYIEGDRGRSFPSVYFWTHSFINNGSLMLSIADIPFGLFHFTGLIGFINHNGKTIIMGTYNNAKVLKISEEEIIVKRGKYKLFINLIKKNEYPLKAPILGTMDRIIKESCECVVKYKLIYKNDVIFDEIVNNSSFEYEYINEREFSKLK